MTMKIYGYLLTTKDRSLFVRNREDIGWADDDDGYEIKTLVAADEIEPTPQSVYEQPTVEDGKSSPEFDAYKEIAEDLYRIQQEQLSSTKTMLEDAIELIEGIGELSAKKTENLMEMRGLLALIAQDCKKFLAPSDGE